MLLYGSGGYPFDLNQVMSYSWIHAYFLVITFMYSNLCATVLKVFFLTGDHKNGASD